MKEALLIISLLSVFIFFTITIFRIVMAVILKFTINKYLKLLSMLRPKESNSDNYVPSSRNDVLYRDKDIEKRKEVEAQKINNVKRLPKLNEESLDLEPNYNKKNIVGIVKPIGYWTSLIMGQKVVGLMQHAEMLKEQNDSGYWVNMVHSQRVGRGRDRGI